MQAFSIIIGGDFVSTRSNRDLFISARISELFGDDLLAVLAQADFRVFNLECPLADKEAPIMKNGPNLIAPTSTINAIKGIKTDLLSLANNHILDQGEQGLCSTLETLAAHSISYVGAGRNLNQASKPFIVTNERLSFGIYACAEHEFTIATDDSAGANPFDPLESLDHINDLKNKCDYVIVLYHGGKEHYRYPSPDLKKICHKIMDKGADLVVCQHSHCIGAFEEYNAGTIVYGQGNFLFDDSQSELWQTSLLIKVTVTGQGLSIDYIPIVKQGNGVRLAGKDRAEEIMSDFYHRSEMISDQEFLKREFEIMAAKMLDNYLTAFYGESFIFRVINKLFRYRLTSILHSKKSLTRLRNFIECEAHREFLSAGLREKIRL